MPLGLGHSSLAHSERIESEASFKTRVCFPPLVLGRGVCVRVAQLCLTLPYSIDGGLPVSSVHGISQARILEWAAIPYSRGSSRPRGKILASHTGADFLSYHLSHQGSPKQPLNGYGFLLGLIKML